MAGGHAQTRRTSDRWITPGVVLGLIFAATLLVLATLAAVTYLSARGVDAGPIVQLVGVLVAAATSLVQLVLQLVARKGQAKIEQAAGTLPGSVGGAVADALAEVLTPPQYVDEDQVDEHPPATALYASTGPLPPVPGTRYPARTS